MADPDEALIEAIAEALDEWLFRMHGLTSSCSHRDEARAAHAAMVAHLGLVEKRRASPRDYRRLVRRFESPWVEVDHGSE